jgi:hypothetical protein
MSTRFIPMLLSFFWIACSDRQDANPFDSLLQQPPYASWKRTLKTTPSIINEPGFFLKINRANPHYSI